MRTQGAGRRTWAGLVTTLVLGLAGVAGVEAQQAERSDCRCVDGDGNPIERCVCVVRPEVSGMLSAVEAGTPRLGISLSGTQDARVDAQGALVAEVLEGGPADEAGIREGDVIVSLDGRRLTESIGADDERDFDLDGSVPVQRMLAFVRTVEPGDEVEVVYLRDGARRTTTIEAEELSSRWGPARLGAMRPQMERLQEQLRRLSERSGARAWRPAPGAEDRRRDGDVNVFRIRPGTDPSIFPELRHRDGLELTALNPTLGAYFGAEAGVLVIDVRDGPGLGLEPGDVVLAVGDRTVSSPDRFRRIVSSYGEDEDIPLRIRRDDRETTIVGRFRYY